MGDFSLPVLPVPLANMTRDSLRKFIPFMISQAEGIAKIKMGNNSQKPAWWPEKIPWSTIRSDTRTEADIKKSAWVEALRDVVKRCYQYYGAECMLSANTDVAATPVKLVNNMNGSVSFITDGTVVRIAQNSQSNYVNDIPTGFNCHNLPAEAPEVLVPTQIFKNIQGSAVCLTEKAYLDVFSCNVCKKKFPSKAALKKHSSQCPWSESVRVKLPVRRKLKVVPVDELPRADRKSFISALNLVPQSRAKIMKRQRNRSKDIEIISIDSDDDQSIRSPTTPKTPKSLMSQLSRDLSPPGKSLRRKSLLTPLGCEEGEDKDCSESEATKSEINGKREGLGNRSVLSIDVCSYLGQRVKKLMQQQAEQHVSSLSDPQDGYERFCHTPKKNEALSRLRSRPSEHPVTFKKTKKTCPKNAHQYKFKSSQRKEWYLTNLFGLNARSRALRKLVKKCQVKIQKLSEEELARWRRKRAPVNNQSMLREGFLLNRCNQDLLSKRNVSSSDGNQFLLPNNYKSDKKILPPKTFTQQRILLPKLDAVTVKSASSNHSSAASSNQARPVHLVRHGDQVSNGVRKLLKRPLNQRLEQCRSNNSNRQKIAKPYNNVSSRKQKSSSLKNDVICLSSDDESNSSSGLTPSKRQKMESKTKSRPTLLFKCHLCHNELTCQNDIAGYIENHFAQAHNVHNLQLIEHTDTSGQKIVSIVEKTGKKKTGNPFSKSSSHGNRSMSNKSKGGRKRESVAQAGRTRASSGMFSKKSNDVICID